MFIPTGTYADDRWVVATHYFQHMFIFDVITSIPVSFFELAAAASCARVEGEVDSAMGTQVRLCGCATCEALTPEPRLAFRLGCVQRVCVV